MKFCPCTSDTGAGARDAAKTGARLGAAAGARGGPFATGLGAGFGGALGYLAGTVTDDVEAKLDRKAVTDGGEPVAATGADRDDGVTEIPVTEEPLFD